MRHVIAGETQEDTIEWRLLRFRGRVPTLEARRVGDVDWCGVFWLHDDKCYVETHMIERLGLAHILCD